MDIRFETPTLAEAPALVAVEIRSFHDDARLYPGVEAGGPPGYDSVAWMTRNLRERLCHKIVHAGQIIGGIVVIDEGAGHYHLDLLFIDPTYHNQGIGTQAMRFIESRYSARQWTLDTPVYATRNQHFYEKLGYVRVGEASFADDVPLFRYEKFP